MKCEVGAVAAIGRHTTGEVHVAYNRRGAYGLSISRTPPLGFGPEWSGFVGPEWSGAVGWATLFSPGGPEWSGAVGWATLFSPVVPSGAVLWAGRPYLAPLVPSGAVLWAGRPYLAPWSRVERCCGLGDPI